MTANAAELAPWLDTRRLPELSPRAAQRLQRCLQHPDAPRLSGRSGHHLDAAALCQLQSDKQLLQCPDSQWLTAFLDHCRRRVPRYRSYPWHLGFDALPCTSRQDLSSDVAAFVPTDIDPQQLIVFETSGTTGHPLRVPSLPLVAARYHCFHERIVGWHGIDLQTLPGDTGVMLVGDQQRCFTYASVLPYWDDKVLLKLNMNPADWPSAAARRRYLDTVKPLLMTGDPRSLSTLLTVEFAHQPSAILSTSMTLLDGLKARLRERFACPVINLYSMNEAGPIAACDGSGNGLRLVQSTLKVELLDRQGRAVPAGARGEITITGGFNPCMPLLRYRTGDYACLYQSPDGHQYLQQLDGRPPVRFYAAGRWLNNVDITHLMQPFELAQYQLHQQDDGNLVLRLQGNTDEQALRRAIAGTFGHGCQVSIEPFPLGIDKLIQYTSDYPGAHDG